MHQASIPSDDYYREYHLILYFPVDTLIINSKRFRYWYRFLLELDRKIHF